MYLPNALSRFHWFHMLREWSRWVISLNTNKLQGEWGLRARSEVSGAVSKVTRGTAKQLKSVWSQALEHNKVHNQKGWELLFRCPE